MTSAGTKLAGAVTIGAGTEDGRRPWLVVEGAANWSGVPIVEAGLR